MTSTISMSVCIWNNKNQLTDDECATNQKQGQEQEPPSEFKDKSKVSAIKHHRLLDLSDEDIFETYF